MINSYAYSPWGACNNLSGTTFGFTGQRYDHETGLYYYKNRYYSPEIGRFLQPDPTQYSDGLNVYAYVGNNPLNNSDPNGLAATGNSGYYATSFEHSTSISSANKSTAYWGNSNGMAGFVYWPGTCGCSPNNPGSNSLAGYDGEVLAIVDGDELDARKPKRRRQGRNTRPKKYKDYTIYDFMARVAIEMVLCTEGWAKNKEDCLDCVDDRIDWWKETNKGWKIGKGFNEYLEMMRQLWKQRCREKYPLQVLGNVGNGAAEAHRRFLQFAGII